MNEQQIEVLKTLGEVFDSQYAQRPTKTGGNLFKIDWFATISRTPSHGLACNLR
jgi:hypothetical protein